MDVSSILSRFDDSMLPLQQPLREGLSPPLPLRHPVLLIQPLQEILHAFLVLPPSLKSGLRDHREPSPFCRAGLEVEVPLVQCGRDRRAQASNPKPLPSRHSAARSKDTPVSFCLSEMRLGGGLFTFPSSRSEISLPTNGIVLKE